MVYYTKIMESSVQYNHDFVKDVHIWMEDGRTALKNINLEIKKGEFILISGKLEVVKALLEV